MIAAVIMMIMQHNITTEYVDTLAAAISDAEHALNGMYDRFEVLLQAACRQGNANAADAAAYYCERLSAGILGLTGGEGPIFDRAKELAKPVRRVLVVHDGGEAPREPVVYTVDSDNDEPDAAE